MTNYQILSQEEQDDILVSFSLAQERDKFCHELNLARYTKMLVSSKEGKWRDTVLKLRQETTERLAEVNSIIEATQSQLPSPERIAAAKLRLLSQVK